MPELAGRRVSSLVVVAVVVGCVTVPPSMMSAVPRNTCHGLPVTVAAHAGLVHGTPRADIIRLDGPAKVIAGPGRDLICGSPGADDIRGGSGDDVVLGRGGNDRIRGGPGRDSLFGDAGNDDLDGGGGRDTIMGGEGADVISSPRRPAVAVAGEKALAVDGDQLMPGSTGVSLVLTNFSTLRALSDSGRRVAAAWGDGGGQVVAAPLDLREHNALTFTGRPTVYLAPGDLRDGSTLVPKEATVVVPWGYGVIFGLGGDARFTPSALGPELIGASYDMGERGGQVTVSGLNRWTWLNGVGLKFAPMSAPLVIPPFARIPEARLKAPDTLSLFVGPEARANPGAVWAASLPDPRIAFPVRTESVKAVSYDAIAGFRAD